MVSRGFQKRNFCGEQKRKGFFSFRICFHPFRTFGLLLKRMTGRTPCSGFFNTADRVPSTWWQVGGKCRQLGGKSSQVGGKLHCRIGRSRLRHNRPKRLRITVHEQEQRLHGLLLALCRHLRYCFMDAAMKYCATITVGRVVPNAPRRAEDSPPYQCCLTTYHCRSNSHTGGATSSLPVWRRIGQRGRCPSLCRTKGCGSVTHCPLSNTHRNEPDADFKRYFSIG